MPAACRSEAVSNTIGDVSAYFDGLKARASRGHARLKNFVWTRLIGRYVPGTPINLAASPTRDVHVELQGAVQKAAVIQAPDEVNIPCRLVLHPSRSKLGLHNAMRYDPG